MKKVSGTLKLAYSQYRELQAFAQFGSDLDKDTLSRLAQGERIVEVLKQNRNTPIATELQVIIIYAVINNFLQDIDTADITDFQFGLFEYIENTYGEILDEIKTTGDLSKENSAKIEKAIEEFKAKFLSLK